MTAATSHRLDGLESDNLLAFLALLGLLRALETTDKTLCLRAAWDVDTPPLRPRLFIDRTITAEEVTQGAAKGIEAIAAGHDFGSRKDLNLSRAECRALLNEKRRFQHRCAGARRSPAALMSDAAIKDDKKEPVDPTPLCLLFGQGHQHFLERLAIVPREEAPPPRGKGKKPLPCPHPNVWPKRCSSPGAATIRHSPSAGTRRKMFVTL